MNTPWTAEQAPMSEQIWVRDSTGKLVAAFDGEDKDKAYRMVACVNVLSGLNPEGIKELVGAVDHTVSVWQYEPCHAKALALERVTGDLQDALAKVKKED